MLIISNVKSGSSTHDELGFAVGDNVNCLDGTLECKMDGLFEGSNEGFDVGIAEGSSDGENESCNVGFEEGSLDGYVDDTKLGRLEGNADGIRLGNEVDVKVDSIDGNSLGTAEVSSDDDKLAFLDGDKVIVPVGNEEGNRLGIFKTSTCVGVVLGCLDGIIEYCMLVIVMEGSFV